MVVCDVVVDVVDAGVVVVLAFEDQFVVLVVHHHLLLLLVALGLEALVLGDVGGLALAVGSTVVVVERLLQRSIGLLYSRGFLLTFAPTLSTLAAYHTAT